MCFEQPIFWQQRKNFRSRVRFYRPTDGKLIDLHKSHPNPEMDVAAVKALKAFFGKHR